VIERRTLKEDLRRSVVSITAKGLRLIESVAPSSEAIYAEITRRYGADKLAELHALLQALEVSLWDMPLPGGDHDSDEGDASL